MKALNTSTTQDSDQSLPIIIVSRVLLICAGGYAGFSAASRADWMAQSGYSHGFTAFILVVLGSAVGYLFGGMLGRELFRWYENVRRRLLALDKIKLVLAAIGFLVGLLVAFVLSSSFLRYIEEPQWLGLVATVVLYVLCAYSGASLFVMSSQAFAARPESSVSRSVSARPPKLLDTSAVIDGRFAGLADAGLLEDPLRVPRFVLAELQTLADSADDNRRTRGRRGLDVLTKLAGSVHPVTVLEADYPDVPTVDAKLVRLAAQSGGVLVTVDHNLTEVARVQGIAVVNVNEAAEALRPLLLPGDSLEIGILRAGKEAGQGVGYLEDGTMVVVSDAAGDIGLDRIVTVTSVLQTASGRMVFARKGAE